MSLTIIGGVYTSRIGDSNQLKEAITEWQNLLTTDKQGI